MAIGLLGLLLINTALFVAGSILQHQLAKAPDVKPGEPQIPTVDPSKKIPIIFGTVRLTMNVFRFGKMYADPITIRQNTSLITYHTPTVGYAYHWWMMGWLCYGQISGLIDVIFEGNKPLSQYGTGKYFSGTVTQVVSTPAGFVSYERPVYADTDGLVGDGNWMGDNAHDGFQYDLNAPDLFGGVDQKTGAGQGGIVGRMRVYNGCGSHNVNAEMQAINDAKILPGDDLYPYTEPTYPDWAYVVLENLYMGTQPQCPPMEFIVARPPLFKLGFGNPFLGLEVPMWGLDNYTFRYGAANPIGALLEILINDDWGMGWPRDLIDFGVMETVWGICQEAWGFCMTIDGDMTAEDALGEILRTIDGVLYLSPVTSKLTAWLMRGRDEAFGYGDVMALPLIHPGNAAISTWEKVAQKPGINELVVEFANCEKGFLKDTVKVQNQAAIQAAGRINSETVQYMSITGKERAAMLGQRDLRAISQEVARGDVEMNREGFAFHPGQWARFTWPEFGIENLVVRVGNIDPGTLKDGKVKISIVEDYWSQGTPSYKTIYPTGVPTMNLRGYNYPTAQELYLADTPTQRVVGLAVADPDNHVTLVEFSINGAWTTVADPYVFTIVKSASQSQLVQYRITYTREDGADGFIIGSFGDIPSVMQLQAPTLSYEVVGTNVVITASLPAGATGVKFAYATDTKPSNSTVLAATPDTTAPYDLTLPSPAPGSVLYVGAAATDGINNSLISWKEISSTVVAASTAEVVLSTTSSQFPSGRVLANSADGRITWDRSAANLIKPVLDLSGVAGLDDAIGAGAGVYEINIFSLGSGEEKIINIPAAFTEIHRELRQAALLEGMDKFRLVGNVTQMSTGGKIRIGHGVIGSSTFTDPGTGADLPLDHNTGLVRSNWMTVPGPMGSDVDVSPHALGGDGTRTAKLSSLKLQFSPKIRTGGETPPVGSGGGGSMDFHYDAQALATQVPGIADEDALLVWPDVDAPGSLHDAVSNSPSFPNHYDVGAMNGHPGVRFDYLGNNARGFGLPVAFAPTEGEAFLVMRGMGTPDGAFQHMSSAPNYSELPAGVGGTLYDGFGSTVRRSFTLDVDPTQPIVYHVRARAGEWTCRINGVVKFTTSTNTTAWGTNAIGLGVPGFLVSLFVGWYGEIIYRGTAGWLSDSDAAALTTILKSKWSIL